MLCFCYFMQLKICHEVHVFFYAVAVELLHQSRKHAMDGEKEII